MRSSSSRQARKASSRSAVPSDKAESRSAMTAACASNVAAAVRSRPGFGFVRGACPEKTARVMKPLVERPEAWTRAANSSRRSAGGRYETGGARFFRAMAATVGGRHAALPRAFPARSDPLSATRPLRRRVDGFPKGEPTSPLWSKPVPKHRSWSRSAKAPGRGCKGRESPLLMVHGARRLLVVDATAKRCPEGVHGGRDGPPGKVGVVLPRTPCAHCRSRRLLIPV